MMDEARARRTMGVVLGVLIIFCGLFIVASTANHVSHAPSSPASTTAQQPQSASTLPLSAASVMTGITEANPVSEPYNRSEYQPTWDVGSGCDLRSRLLSAASIMAVQYTS